MIEFSRSYKATDGKCYSTLEEAQAVEIERIRAICDVPDSLTVPKEVQKDLARAIVANKDSIVNVLTLNDSSRPRARGQKRPRKPKTQPAPDPDLIPVAQ